jgi:hypothetical protein
MLPVANTLHLGNAAFHALMYEAGSGSKDANYVINNLLLQLVASGFNGHQTIIFVFDCASVERNAWVAGKAGRRQIGLSLYVT